MTFFSYVAALRPLNPWESVVRLAWSLGFWNRRRIEHFAVLAFWEPLATGLLYSPAVDRNFIVTP